MFQIAINIHLVCRSLFMSTRRMLLLNYCRALLATLEEFSGPVTVIPYRYIERFSLDCRKGLVLVLVLVLLRPLVG